MKDSIQDKYDYSVVKNRIQDLITKADPYSGSQHDGDAMLRDLLDLVSAARVLDADSMQDISDTLKKQYGYQS